MTEGVTEPLKLLSITRRTVTEKNKDGEDYTVDMCVATFSDGTEIAEGYTTWNYLSGIDDLQASVFQKTGKLYYDEDVDRERELSSREGKIYSVWQRKWREAVINGHDIPFAP